MITYKNELQTGHPYRIHYSSMYMTGYIRMEGLLDSFSHNSQGIVNSISLTNVLCVTETGKKTFQRHMPVSMNDVTMCLKLIDNNVVKYYATIDPYIGFKYGFPTKGWCKNPTEELEKYIIKNFGSNMSLSDSRNKKNGGIVWTGNSYWYVDNFSSYPELDIEDLLPYLKMESGNYIRSMDISEVLTPSPQPKSIKTPTIEVELIKIKSRIINNH